jgi:hypothetical protein
VPDPEIISTDDIAQAFAACEGNMRETLFKLYDLFEARTR